MKDAAGNTFTYTPTGHLATTTGPDGTTTGHTYWPTGLRKTTTQTNTVTTSNDIEGGGNSDSTGEQQAAAAGVSEITAYWTPQAPGASVAETAVEEAADGTRASHLLAATRETRTLLGSDGKPATPEGAETGYLLHDRLGSTTHLTGADGSVTTGYTYTDYGTTTRTPTNNGNSGGTGAPTTPTGLHRNPYTYTGATTDQATGHHYLRSRTYNPTTTHFTTRDTANLLNRYTYTTANPLKYTDQTGNTPTLADWITFGLNIAFVALDVAATVLTFGLSAPATLPAAVIGLAAVTTSALSIADAYHPDLIKNDKALQKANWALSIANTAASTLTSLPSLGVRASGVLNPRNMLQSDRSLIGITDDAIANIQTMVNSLYRGRKGVARTDGARDLRTGSPYYCDVTAMATCDQLMAGTSNFKIGANRKENPSANARTFTAAQHPKVLAAAVGSKWEGPFTNPEAVARMQAAGSGTHFYVFLTRAGKFPWWKGWFGYTPERIHYLNGVSRGSDTLPLRIDAHLKDMSDWKPLSGRSLYYLMPSGTVNVPL